VKSSDFFQVDAAKYRKIIAFKSWDGVISAGLFLRLFSLPVKFKKIIHFSRESIIIGVLFYIDADILGSLIIDRFDCKKPVIANIRLGNLIICEERYPSLTELISDVFNLEIDDELLNLVNKIEKSELDNKARKMLYSRIAYLDVFPYNEMALAISGNNSQVVWDWIEEKAESQRIAELLEKKEKILENSTEIFDGVRVMTFSVDDTLEVGAIELIIRELIGKEKLSFFVALKDERVKGFYVISKKLDLIKLMKNLMNLGFVCGGRSNFGRCKAAEETLLKDFNEKILTAIMASYRKL